MDRDKYYQGLRRTITGIIVAVSITPLIVLIAVAGYEFHTAYRAKSLAYLEQLVSKHAEDVDAFLNERLYNIRLIASLKTHEQLSNEKILDHLLGSLRKEHSDVFVDLGLVNSKGIQEAYAGPFKLGRADYSDAGWFEEVMGRQFYVSDVFLGLRGMPHFIVAVKQTDPDHPDAPWVLRATVDFVAFNRLVGNIRMGKTGQAFIINRRGEFQTRPGIDMSSYVPVLQDRLWNPAGQWQWNQETSWDPASGIPLAAERPVRVYNDKNPVHGTPALYVASYLKSGNWALVYMQDRNDAFSSLIYARNITVGLFVVSSGIILLMGYVLSRRVAARIKEVDKSKEVMNEKVIEAGKLASIGELAAGIAHEINNPVAIMVEEAGWIGDILDDEKGDCLSEEDVEEVRRALSQIKTQGTRCKQITHKLLSFARKTDPVAVEVNLNELIREVVGLSAQHAKYGNIDVRMDLTVIPMITASPSEMQQVLLNLINNSIDAIDPKEGGTLTLKTRDRDGSVELTVSDNGMGIPKANLSKIFDPFFTTKGVGKGTGLGLSICYGIIDKMGGKISVSSVAGAGTTFLIRLPATGRRLDGTELKTDED